VHNEIYRPIWRNILEKIDKLPEPSPLAIGISNILVAVLAFLFAVMMLSTVKVAVNAQTQQQGIAIQQAITQQQVVANASDIVGLRKDVEYQRDQVLALREEVSRIEGVAIGFSVVISLMQVVQVVMQLRTRTAKGSDE
jgi:hypothetical protein